MHYQRPGHHSKTNHIDPLTLQRTPKPPVSIDTFWNIFHDENDEVAIVVKMDAWDVISPGKMPHLIDFKRNGYQLLRQKIEEKFSLNGYATVQDARAVLGEYPGQHIDEVAVAASGEKLVFG